MQEKKGAADDEMVGWHSLFCPIGRVMNRELTRESNRPSISLGNEFEASIFLGKGI